MGGHGTRAHTASRVDRDTTFQEAIMNTFDDPEVKRYRTMGAALSTFVVLGVVAGLAAIGAQSPDRQHLTLNCAYDPSALTTMTDAMPEIPGACATGSAAREAAASRAEPRYGVPDAATALDPRAEPAEQPPTF
jgi:hypothetical protein